ncbi:hypothetical protein HHK36_012969 [Tetracentron sinense]|uniref:Serine incorporator n=1 Tax=Tetracentron sinense TaxID=13715 RepID=A0A835DF05_TETSI|nr:hypothetical protein HHK36_012969 [Tetracentron sinense]
MIYLKGRPLIERSGLIEGVLCIEDDLIACPKRMSESTEAVQAKVVEFNPQNLIVVPWEEPAVSMEQKSVDYSVERRKSLRARYAYGFIFLLTNLVGWFVRDYGHDVFPELHYLKACGIGGHDCFRTMGVLRVSLGCFVSFEGLLAKGKISIHTSEPSTFPLWTSRKLGELARIGAGIFLLLQLISVIEFITWWNNYWMPDARMKHSEPAIEKCNQQKEVTGNGNWTTVLSFLIAICAIVIATFSTGIDSQSFQFRKDEIQQEDDIPYKYGFFHIIFSMGAMYFAMLFISWELDNSTRKWSIDVGWASTWVKIVNEWFAATIYCIVEIDFPSSKADKSHGSSRARAIYE